MGSAEAATSRSRASVGRFASAGAADPAAAECEERQRPRHVEDVDRDPVVLFDGFTKYDTTAGTSTLRRWPEGCFGGEVVFAPRVGSRAEDDGYLITMVADMQDDSSEIMVLRADDITAGPVARILLPERMGIGTHACWVEADRLQGENRTPVLN